MVKGIHIGRGLITCFKVTLFLCLAVIAGGDAHARQKATYTLHAIKDVFKRTSPFESFVDDEFKLDGKPLKDHLTLFEPLVLHENDRIRVSHFLRNEQDTLLRMNDLSYKIVRNADTQMKTTLRDMRYLREQGWIMQGFSGLEGRRNTYPDLSGMVCYHPQYNLIVVVYRGTAGNKDGWDTNFDASKINPAKIQKEYCNDLFDEAVDLLKASGDYANLKDLKKLIRHAQKDESNYQCAKNTYQEVKAYFKKHPVYPALEKQLVSLFEQKLEVMKAVKKLGGNIEGEVHRGFLKKYMTTKREVLEIIQNHIASMTKDQKAKLKILFTGHSQAGATGNLALSDICANHGKDLFGSKFNNQLDHRFYGYFLSAARIGDKDYKKWVHDHVGQAYIIRQNVDGDLAPISQGDQRIAKAITQVPVVGEVLAKRFAEYDDTGYLLLDDGHKVWKRARDLYEHEGYNTDQLEETEDLVRYIASWVIQDEQRIPKFISPKKEGAGFWWSPIRWTKNRIKTAKALNLVRLVLMGDEDAIKDLEKFTSKLITRYAHLHYGHFRPETGAVFDPQVVGRDLDVMAKRGLEKQTGP